MAKQIRIATFWTDGRGRRHDITKISDDYLQNIIAWLQRRKQNIRDAAAEEGYIIDDILAGHSSDLQNLLNEAMRRCNKGIVIDRADDIEETYQ